MKYPPVGAAHGTPGLDVGLAQPGPGLGGLVPGHGDSGPDLTDVRDQVGFGHHTCRH